MAEHSPGPFDKDRGSARDLSVEQVGKMLESCQIEEIDRQAKRHETDRMRLEAEMRMRQTGQEECRERRSSLQARQASDYRNLVEIHREEKELFERDGPGAIDAIDKARDERGQPRARDEPVNDR